MPPRLPLTPISSPLLRPILPAPRRLLSTTSALLASPPKAKASEGAKKQSYGKKKNTKDESRKGAYAIGERRGIRTRIVLSNTNAQPLDTPPLTSDLSNITEAAGNLFAFPEEEVDKLRTLRAFFRTQDWRLFARPSSVLRRQAMEIGSTMDSFDSVTRRIILDGYKGSGKSVMLLQLMTWALQKGWIVINIPNAQELVIGHTDYEFDPASGKWTHPSYTSHMLTQRIAKVNATALANLSLTTTVKLGRNEYAAGTPLLTAVSSAGRDFSAATDTLRFLLSELQNNPDTPKVLFAVENFNLFQVPTVYRDPDFKIIHPHDFALPSLFNELLRGERKFHNGGLAIGVTSRTIAPRAEAFELFLRGEEIGPYSKADRRIHEGLQGAEVMEMSGMDGEEAASLLEYCRDTGLLKVDEVDEGLIREKLLLSSGLPKEIVKSCVRIARC